LTEDVGDLSHLTAGPHELEYKFRNNILRWLGTEYKNSRGFGLGTHNKSLLARVMKSQSCNWEAIATGYIHDIITMVHKFIIQLLGLVCSQLNLSSEVMSVLLDELTMKYENSLTQTRFLLSIERENTPLTLNHYFNDNLEKE
jgi:hypothetical protein